MAPLALTACLIGFYLMPFAHLIARDALNLSAAFLVFFTIPLVQWKKPPPANLWLAAGLMVAALLTFAWYQTFHAKGPFGSLYTQYNRMGRTLVTASLLVFALSCYQLKVPVNALRTVFIVGGLAINIFALMAGKDVINSNVHAADRLRLSLPSQTATAYMLSAIDILMIHGALSLRSKWRYVLLVIIVTLSYSTLVLTATRSAILMFPVALLVIIAFDQQSRIKYRLLFLVTMIIVFTASAFALKPILETRFQSLQRDIHLYEQKNSSTSVGTRFALFQTGWKSGVAHPVWQSVESRNSHIGELIQKDMSLQGASRMLSTHMHNELIEAFSLRGVPGILVWLWVYAALFWVAFRKNERNISFLGISLCAVLYGMSDVILFNREVGAIYLSGLVFSLVFRQALSSQQKSTEPNR